MPRPKSKEQKMKIVFGLVTLAIAGCTDAQMAQIQTLGDAAEIKCYSGGNVIYEGKSTGKVSSEEKSDGWYFKDASNGKLIRTNADCIITN